MRQFFKTTTPYLSAYLDIGAEMFLGAQLEIDYIVDTHKEQIAGFEFNESRRIEVDTLNAEGSFTVDDFIHFDVNSPDIGVIGSAKNAKTISGQSEDVFLSTAISFDDLLVEKVLKPSTNPKAKALGSAWQDEIDIDVAGIEWDLLDIALVGDVALKTSYDVSFDSVIGKIYLEDEATKFKNGQNATSALEFNVNNRVSEIDLLTGQDRNNNGYLDYAVEFELENPTLTTDVDLVFDLDFDVAALQGSAWYDVWLIVTVRALDLYGKILLMSLREKLMCMITPLP